MALTGFLLASLGVAGLGCGGSKSAESTTEPAVAESAQATPPAGLVDKAEPEKDAASDANEDGDGAEAKDPAAKADTDKPTTAPAVVHATGAGRGVELLVLHEHELLGSEGRALDKYVAALGKGGFAATRVESPSESRRAAAQAWLAEVDPAVRQKMPTAELLGDAAALIIVRVEAPDRRVAKGANAYAIVLRGEAPELVWMRDEGAGQQVLGDDVKLVMPLLEGVEGVKQ